MQKSESKIRFSTRSAVFVRNPLKISCLSKFSAFLRWCTAIKSFFARGKTLRQQNATVWRAIIAAVMFCGTNKVSADYLLY